MFQHKRGETLSLAGSITATDGEDLPSFLGWVGSAQVRLLDGTLVADLEVSWLDVEQGFLKVYKKDTQNWPLGVAEIDIKFVNTEGETLFTTTKPFTIVREVTNAGA